MTGQRTVTVQTRDHGAVTVPEPEWCTGVGHEVVGDYRADISHYGPDEAVTVGGPTGPRELLTLILAQHLESGSDRWPGTALHVAVHLADGLHHAYDIAGLDRLADDIVEAAQQVRAAARRLAAVQDGGAW